MNSKVVTGALVVVLVYSGFLTYKFSVLEQKVAELENNQQEQVSITPSQTPPPGAPSPFDQPNVDPNSPQAAASNAPQTTVSFASTEHNFGKIKDGEKVRTRFKFTNTGSNPLIITNAQGSCGCTVPAWPKEPIAPGKGGEIEVEFDSKGKSGENTKNVVLTANAPTPELIIKSTVIPADK